MTLIKVRDGSCKRRHPREAIPVEDRQDCEVPGVSFCYNRGAFRAQGRYFKEADQAIAFLGTASAEP